MPASATTFTHAIVRRPAASAIHGLRSVDRGAPDIDALRREHAAYIDILTRVGLTVDVLGPLEAFPDSVFVEDPALVFPEGAILLRPGAASRLGEAAEIRSALDDRFGRVLALEEGFADGGDVLRTPDAVYIGLSARTDEVGATALSGLLATLGYRAVIVRPPDGVLHLKTACSLVDDRTLLATREIADAGLIADLDVVIVPDGEDLAANLLGINGVVLMADGFPQTSALLAARGHEVRTLTVGEVMKLDAGLSCMSLRW
ncbi:dimethylarginine dimethylaminohydrolase family protein [Luteitalea sp.]|jgi:dimethylargininase|uniref:dimethylarginine dimethylaminohydrolase family protein n=1 Tax=Luteitalea sp. TaxID=2004800 RepID=UPI0037C7FA23